MNKIYSILATIFLITAISCKEDEQQLSIEEKQIEMLSGNWQLISAKRDNADMDGYEDFELVLSSSSSMLTYISINRPSFSPWEAGGVIQFGANPLQELVRDAGTNHETFLNYEVSEDELTISFNYDGDGFENNRNNAIQGSWVFRFSN